MVFRLKRKTLINVMQYFAIFSILTQFFYSKFLEAMFYISVIKNAQKVLKGAELSGACKGLLI